MKPNNATIQSGFDKLQESEISPQIWEHYRSSTPDVDSGQTSVQSTASTTGRNTVMIATYFDASQELRMQGYDLDTGAPEIAEMKDDV